MKKEDKDEDLDEDLNEDLNEDLKEYLKENNIFLKQEILITPTSYSDSRIAYYGVFYEMKFHLFQGNYEEI